MAWRKNPDDDDPPPLDPLDSAAIEAWAMSGGMDWSALPWVCEILSIDDVEGLVLRMMRIRDRK